MKEVTLFFTSPLKFDVRDTKCESLDWHTVFRGTRYDPPNHVDFVCCYCEDGDVKKSKKRLLLEFVSIRKEQSDKAEKAAISARIELQNAKGEVDEALKKISG